MSGYWIGKDEAILVRKKEFEQLTARVKELEQRQKWIDEAKRPDHPDDERPWCCEYLNAKERISALEQQLNDEKGICEALRSQNSDAVEEVQKLEQQIQQAERRGYELAKAFGTYKWIYGQDGTIVAMDDDIKWNTYEQAKAERDAQDGAK